MEKTENNLDKPENKEYVPKIIFTNDMLNDIREMGKMYLPTLIYLQCYASQDNELLLTIDNILSFVGKKYNCRKPEYKEIIDAFTQFKNDGIIEHFEKLDGKTLLHNSNVIIKIKDLHKTTKENFTIINFDEIKKVNEIFRKEENSIDMLNVYLYIARYVGADNRYCQKSQEEIANCVVIGVKTLIEIITRLEELKIITIEKGNYDKDRKKNMCDKYTINSRCSNIKNFKNTTLIKPNKNNDDEELFF